LGDLIAIKKRRPNVRIVLNVLCHPTGLTRRKVAIQNWYFRRSLKFLDAVIASSDVMKRYLERNVARGQQTAIWVIPPYYSKVFHPHARKSQCEFVPNVLFLGRTDWRRAQASDNVETFLDQLTREHVHVFHHRSPESDVVTPFRHSFEYMSLREAETYATQFDVALIVYNLDACQRTDRFEVTVPDRLIASVTAGIPIAIPSAGYGASKEYLRDYGAVIEFETAADLAMQLKDSPKLRALKSLAAQNSQKYVAEYLIHGLIEAIRTLCTPASPKSSVGAVLQSEGETPTGG
jgi:hypothetical protein